MADAGKNSVIEIALKDSSGTIIQKNSNDFNPACLRSSGLSLSTDMLDTTCFNSTAIDSWRRKIEGLKDGSLTLDGDFDDTDDYAQVSLIDAFLKQNSGDYVGVKWYPFGTSGKSFQFDARVESFDPSTDVEDKVTVSYSLSTISAVTYA